MLNCTQSKAAEISDMSFGARIARKIKFEIKWSTNKPHKVRTFNKYADKLV